MASMWIIVYPRGDRSKLSIVEICEGMEHEKRDYSIASRREFYDKCSDDGVLVEEGSVAALKYARQLAKENGLHMDGNQESIYLD